MFITKLIETKLTIYDQNNIFVTDINSIIFMCSNYS